LYKKVKKLFFYQNRYFKKQAARNKNPIEDVSDVESISDTEFDDFLMKTEDDGGFNDENWTLDIAE
jgi:hypothetical protein